MSRWTCWGVCVVLALAGCGRDRRAPQRAPAPAVTQGKVTLGHMHHHAAPAPAAEAPLAWTDAAGTQWEVTRVYVVVGAVELHLCEPPAPRAALLWDALVPSAYAHVPDAATRLGTPFIEELVGRPGRARIVGEVAPPLGDFCEIAAVIAPADADVMNDTELDAEALLGHSLIVQGRRRAPEQPWAPFDLKAAVTDAWTARAIDPKTGQAPLTLGASAPEAFVLLEKTLGVEDFKAHLTEAALKDHTARDAFAHDLLKRLGRTLAVRRAAR